MALKLKITKEEFAKLPADLQAEYAEGSDGSYSLDVTGLDDTGALKRAKDREAQLRKDAEKELKEARERLEALEGDDARKKGDIATLEKSWNSKLETQKNEYESKLTKGNSYIQKMLVDSKALEIATKISTVPNLILPHIKARLIADLDGDEPTTKILGTDGKVSNLTIEQLSAEFVANKDFAPIIIGSKSSGGATKDPLKKTPPGSADTSKIDLTTASTSDLVAHIKAKKEAEANNE